MTQLLERAFQEASKLPPEEQDLLANRLLAELADEQRWDELFVNSQDMLEKMADEALAERRSDEQLGLTQRQCKELNRRIAAYDGAPNIAIPGE